MIAWSQVKSSSLSEIAAGTPLRVGRLEKSPFLVLRYNGTQGQCHRAFILSPVGTRGLELDEEIWGRLSQKHRTAGVCPPPIQKICNIAIKQPFWIFYEPAPGLSFPQKDHQTPHVSPPASACRTGAIICNRSYIPQLRPSWSLLKFLSQNRTGPNPSKIRFSEIYGLFTFEG